MLFRSSREREIGILTQRYQAVAKKNNTCVEYRIIDIIPFPPVNTQIKPSLAVEPSGGVRDIEVEVRRRVGAPSSLRTGR